MPIASKLAGVARSPGDPEVIETGPSSRATSDSVAKGLGWFSLGLGATELLATRRLTGALGMKGFEGLIRAYGAREIASGVTTLSVDSKPGLWSRVAGDTLDIATLVYALRGNRKRGNVGIALAAVAGVAALDLVTAVALHRRHSRGAKGGEPRDYGDRSGWPKGLEASRGAAADFAKPADMRAVPAAAAASPTTGQTSPVSADLAPAASG